MVWERVKLKYEQGEKWMKGGAVFNSKCEAINGVGRENMFS